MVEELIQQNLSPPFVFLAEKKPPVYPNRALYSARYLYFYQNRLPIANNGPSSTLPASSSGVEHMGFIDQHHTIATSIWKSGFQIGLPR